MRDQDHIHTYKLRSGDAVPRMRPERHPKELPLNLRQHIAALGPMPKASLETFVDLGLSDGEMASYFNVPQADIAKLRDIWNIS